MSLGLQLSNNVNYVIAAVLTYRGEIECGDREKDC